MRLHGLALMALFAFSGASLPSHAAEPAPEPFSRDDARDRRAGSQVVSHRTSRTAPVDERRNPILLYVHGPGAAEMVE